MDDFLILIIAIAAIDRFREVFDFDSWFKASPFYKIKNKFLREWFESKDINEFRKLGFIPLHPIFWNAYHFFKNLTFFVLIVYLNTNFILSLILIYITQKVIFYVCSWSAR